ncbi:unnamed protein product, partial [Rotaria magnacalcarata]
FATNSIIADGRSLASMIGINGFHRVINIDLLGDVGIFHVVYLIPILLQKINHRDIHDKALTQKFHHEVH